MQLCPALGEVSGTLTMGKLLEVAVSEAQAYNTCKARHEALVRFVK